MKGSKYLEVEKRGAPPVVGMITKTNAKTVQFLAESS
jgi:hypothetical protein